MPPTTPPCIDTTEEIWLEGVLLCWDQRPNKNRLLIGFCDRDINRPCWIPAPLCDYQLYLPERFGWGVFRIPRAVANRRHWAHDGLPSPQQRPHRTRYFRPKTAKPATRPTASATKQFNLFQ